MPNWAKWPLVCGCPQAAPRQLIADLWAKPGDTPKSPPEPNRAATVTDLAVEFARYAKRKYGDKPEWTSQIRNVLKDIRKTHGHLSAVEFGPVRFENYRQTLVERGLSRTVVKRKSNYVVKMFKRGVKMELIPVELWQRLLSVGPVEMDVKPKKKRWSVDNSIVKATQRELTPLISDMVELQRLIGARPSEVCNIRPCDIDRSSEVWIYTPASHKTEHHGHSRHIAIGPKAQAVLSRYLLRDEKAYCFTPSEAYEQHFTRRHEERSTPMNEGNRPKPRKPKAFKPCYDHNAYRRAIQRAALRAFPVPEADKDDETKVKEWKERYVWRPNQLRKSAAAEARTEFVLQDCVTDSAGERVAVVRGSIKSFERDSCATNYRCQSS